MKHLLLPLTALAVLADVPAFADTSTTMTREEHRMTGVTGNGHLSAEERRFADAYSRATWVHAELAAGDWTRANADLNQVRGDLERIQATRELNPPVKRRVEALLAKVDTLQQQVRNRDTQARSGAAMLVASFSSAVAELAGLGWTGPAGGGAGHGGAPKEKNAPGTDGGR